MRAYRLHQETSLGFCLVQVELGYIIILCIRSENILWPSAKLHILSHYHHHYAQYMRHQTQYNTP